MYVDDILAISADAMKVMLSIKASIKFKNDKIEVPQNYLGAKLSKKMINGQSCWSITSEDYIKSAVQTVEEGLKKYHWKLPTKLNTPMTTSYLPKLDGTEELDADETQLFQEYIGMLRWAIELGRVDIFLEVSLLSQHQASPRQGHMEQILKIYAFLKHKPKLSLYMDPTPPRIDYEMFKTNT